MTSGRLRVVLIAAVGRNGVIGRTGGLPWRLPGDLARFRTETWGKPILFGRRTWVAIDKPLPGRSAIVLSSQPLRHPHGCRAIVPSLDVALATARNEAHRLGAHEIMVGGGGALYDATIALADELRLTVVAGDPEGDTFFPPIDPSVWVETERSAPQQTNGDTLPYRFVRMHRKSP